MTSVLSTIFVCSVNPMVWPNFMSRVKTLGKIYLVPSLSNNLRSCAVAIVAGVKATALSALSTAATSHCSSLTYLLIVKQVSIDPEAPCFGDENICQYGYGICGSIVMVWKIRLKRNSSTGRRSGILKSTFTFPVQP